MGENQRGTKCKKYGSQSFGGGGAVNRGAVGK